MATDNLSAMSIVVVTDSASTVSAEVAAASGVHVVPLQVVIDDVAYDEGAEEASPERVAEALRERRSVSTSRPAPAVFADLYRRLADEGADEILSVHISSEMSGTFESAQVAARHAPVPVTCVDTRLVGPGTGYAVESAAAALAAGGSRSAAADAARTRAALSTSVFYVDSLDYLRRGGRIGGAAAVLGGALAVKPLLGLENGVVTTLEKVRTAGRAISRLQELAVLAADDHRVEITVAHLASQDRADTLTAELAERLEKQLDGHPVRCIELGAVLGAHVGPGLLAICVAPCLPDL